MSKKELQIGKEIRDIKGDIQEAKKDLRSLKEGFKKTATKGDIGVLRTDINEKFTTKTDFQDFRDKTFDRLDTIIGLVKDTREEVLYYF